MYEQVEIVEVKHQRMLSKRITDSEFAMIRYFCQCRRVDRVSFLFFGVFCTFVSPFKKIDCLDYRICQNH